MGTADVAAALAWYNEALGADLVWHFQAFGADVAAVSIDPSGSSPLVVLADHRPVPSCLPIWGVADIDATADWLRATGWGDAMTRVEVPDGPCLVLRDPSGNEIALLQQDRPGAMPAAYEDPSNDRAVRRDR